VVKKWGERKGNVHEIESHYFREIKSHYFQEIESHYFQEIESHYFCEIESHYFREIKTFCNIVPKIERCFATLFTRSKCIIQPISQVRLSFFIFYLIYFVLRFCVSKFVRPTKSRKKIVENRFVNIYFITLAITVYIKNRFES
jgi:hypothetical protein